MEINQAPARGKAVWEVVPAGEAVREDKARAAVADEAWAAAAAEEVRALPETACALNAVKKKLTSAEYPALRLNAPTAASIWSGNSDCNLRHRNY